MSLDLSISNKCKTCENTETFFDRNITHNLVPMWKKAGVYDALYNSDGEDPIKLVKVLFDGLAKMKENPNDYIILEPSNKWGTYESALVFLDGFYIACTNRKINSTIRVSK